MPQTLSHPDRSDKEVQRRVERLQRYLQERAGRRLRQSQIERDLGEHKGKLQVVLMALTAQDPRLAEDDDGAIYYCEE